MAPEIVDLGEVVRCGEYFSPEMGRIHTVEYRSGHVRAQAISGAGCVEVMAAPGEAWDEVLLAAHRERYTMPSPVMANG